MRPLCLPWPAVLISCIAYYEFREVAIDSMDYRLRSNSMMVRNLIQEGKSLAEVKKEITAVFSVRGKVRPWACRLWFDQNEAWFTSRKHIDALFARFSEKHHNLTQQNGLTITDFVDGDRPLRVIWARYHVHINGEPTAKTLNIFGYVSAVHTQHEMQEFLQVLLIAEGVVIIAGIVGLLVTLHVGLRPLGQLIERMEHISGNPGDSAVVDSPDTLAELRPFVTSWKQMLERLSHAMEEENRRFTSDASHELRTPLAVAKSTLQLSRSQKRNAEAYEQAIDQALEDMDRLNILIDTLLELSRLDDHTAGPTYQACDMESLIQDNRRGVSPHRGPMRQGD